MKGWDGSFSPLYPSGSGSVTLSIEDYVDDWAIDSVITDGVRGPLVLYLRSDTPSIYSASREVVTFPGFTCRAMNSGTTCYSISDLHTWSRIRRTECGVTFEPLQIGKDFRLPSALWLQSGGTVLGQTYRVLVGFGFAPAIAFHQNIVYLPETRANTTCFGGQGIVLTAYRVSGRFLAELSTNFLGCSASSMKVPESTGVEASYASVAFKWAGPWAQAYVAFAATDLSSGQYNGASFHE